MIVDDEPFNLLGIKIMISQCGIKEVNQMIDTANSGQ